MQSASDFIFRVVRMSTENGSASLWHRISMKSTGVGLETSQTSSDKMICSMRYNKKLERS